MNLTPSKEVLKHNNELFESLSNKLKESLLQF